MALRVRFVGGADLRLKSELLLLGRWIRRHYVFPVDFELRLINHDVLRDFDGARCYLRWWQLTSNDKVIAEIAVGKFWRTLERKGPEFAFPTVIAAVGRATKYYFQIIRSAPRREDQAERWGDRFLQAYIDGSTPPAPWRRRS